MPSPDPGHVAQVRAASLTSFVPVARSVGLDPFELLREFDIDPQLLADNEARLPANIVSALLTWAAVRSGNEAFGLLLAESRTFGSLGPLSLLLRHETTLRAVVQRIVEYQRLISEILRIDLKVEDGDAFIVVDVAPDVATRQCVELVMALTQRFLDGAMSGGWRPKEAHFRHPAPADASVHERIFQVPLRFDRPFNGFIVPASALERENDYGDPGVVEHARDFVDLLLKELPAPSLPDQARTSVRRLLPSGAATLPRVARELAMHPRALQRKLAAAGLPFAELVQATRENLARDYLANTNLALSDVAALLGYSSPTSFSRWFAGVAGNSPREWRLQGRSAAP